MLPKHSGTQMPSDLGPELARSQNKPLFLVIHPGCRVVGFATENGLTSLYVCGMHACVLDVFTCVFFTMYTRLAQTGVLSPFLASSCTEDIALQ